MTPNAASRQKGQKNTRLGAIAGSIMLLFTKKNKESTPEDLKKHDFPTSTQRMGLRFNERIRGIFRHRWIKKH